MLQPQDNAKRLPLNAFSVLIGSYARGDHDANSDCDILLIGKADDAVDLSQIEGCEPSLVNLVRYDHATFEHLYQTGSLFLFHALNEGRLISGCKAAWADLREKFIVQSDFRGELEEIARITDILRRFEIFGQKYLTPMVHAFVELKNASIFFLAHHGTYEFNKRRCIEMALEQLSAPSTLLRLKDFYDYSIRDRPIEFPFHPNDREACEFVLAHVHRTVKGMVDASK